MLNKVFLNIVLRFLVIGIQFLYFYILLEKDMPAFIGLIGVFLTSVQFFQFVTVSGITNSIISSNKNKVNLYSSTTLFLILVAFFATIIYGFFFLNIELNILLVLLFFISKHYITFVRALNIKNIKILNSKVPEIVYSLSINLIWLFLILDGVNDIKMFLYAFIFSHFLGALISFLVAPRFSFDIKLALNNLKDCLVNNYKFISVDLPFYILKNLDVILVYIFGDLSLTGKYYVLKSIIKVLFVVIEEISSIFFTYMNKKKKQESQVSLNILKIGLISKYLSLIVQIIIFIIFYSDIIAIEVYYFQALIFLVGFSSIFSEITLKENYLLKGSKKRLIMFRTLILLLFLTILYVLMKKIEINLILCVPLSLFITFSLYSFVYFNYTNFNLNNLAKKNIIIFSSIILFVITTLS